MGSIEAICISEKKGTIKKEIDKALLVKEWGIENDAHAGKWHRQVSLLAQESIDKMKKIIPSLENGAFAENIITSGVNLHSLSIGDKIRINGEVLLEVTQIGKECHNSCAIKIKTGDCIMPREGIFAKVLEGGKIKKIDPVEVIRK